MEQVWRNERRTLSLWHGDARHMDKIQDNRVDAVVCDPPRGLGFMRKDWDSLRVYRGQSDNGGPAMRAWCLAWAKEAYRVMKPGAHALVFGGARTFYRLAGALEDGGFELRDTVMCLYGCEQKREAVPAWEPIMLVRKPISEQNVAANLLRWGVGALNIDATRIATAENLNGGAYAKNGSDRYDGYDNWRFKRTGNRDALPGDQRTEVGMGMFAPGTTAAREYQQPTGRWPANVLLIHASDCVQVGVALVNGSRIEKPSDPVIRGYRWGTMQQHRGPRGHGDPETGLEAVERWACVPKCPVRLLDDQAGTRKSGANPSRRKSDKLRNTYGEFKGAENARPRRGGEEGLVSRFFFTSKVSRAERYFGLNQVRPIALMEYLIKLVTPPDGVVLDPFCGSGSTLIAAQLVGVRCAGMDITEECVRIAVDRVSVWDRPRIVPRQRQAALWSHEQ